MAEFAERLKDYLQASGSSVSALAREAGLPRRTIANWLEGYARKPREWHDVIRLASALHLDRFSTDELLTSAGFPNLSTLRAHHPDQVLLRVWHEPAEAVGQHIVAIIGESEGALWQGLPFLKAVYLLEQTVRLAEQLGDQRYLCRLTLELAQCLNALGRTDHALEALHKVLALAADTHQPELRLEAAVLFLRIYTRQDRTLADHWRRTLQRALQEERSLSRPLHDRITYGLGMWAGQLQRSDEAAYYYRQLLDSPDYHLIALNNLSDLAIRQRDYLQAHSLLSEALRAAVTAPDHPILSYVHLNQGIVHLRCGEYALAGEALQAGLTAANRAEDMQAIFYAHLYQAELALQQHNYVGAMIEFQATLTICQQEQFSDAKPFLEYSLARLAKDQGQALLNDPYYRSSLEALG